jgi:hypothetical protein
MRLPSLILLEYFPRDRLAVPKEREGYQNRSEYISYSALDRGLGGPAFSFSLGCAAVQPWRLNPELGTDHHQKKIENRIGFDKHPIAR